MLANRRGADVAVLTLADSLRKRIMDKWESLLKDMLRQVE